MLDTQKEKLTAFVTVGQCLEKIKCEEDKRILREIKESLERELFESMDILPMLPGKVNLTNF